MWISKHKNIDLHWWGNDLLLVHDMDGYYTFEEEEVFFIEHLCKTNVVTDVIYNIVSELDVDYETVDNFINTFMENFSAYFFYSTEETAHSIRISGEKSAYYPLEIHVSLTNRCIQQCIHCYKSATVHGVNIDFNSLASFLDRMTGFVPYLYLSGGEPTLHPDFSNIVNRYSSSYSICVLTSGVRIIPLFHVFARAERGVVVSVYSSVPAVHDKFTRVDGSYTEVMRTIDKAIAMGIPIGVNTLLSTDNFEDIQSLVNMLTQKGVKNITIGKVAPIGRAINGNLELMGSISFDLRKKLQNLNSTHNTVHFLGLTDVDTDSAPLPLSPFECFAGTLTWSIDEYGQIQPCGICSLNELSLGLIAPFNESILYDRIPYIEKVNKFSLVKKKHETGAQCPFV